MSHFKNVQNFDKVIAVCTGLGGNYNPGKQNLQVESLAALMNNAHGALASIKVAKTNSEYATNHRALAFEDLSRLAGRIISELQSSGVLVATVNDARSIQRKLAGFRASRDPVPVTPASTDAAPAKKKRMAKGMDYGTKTENFAQLLQTLRTEPLYQPVINDLMMPALEAKLADLIAKNAQVVQTSVELKNARQYRDDLLYNQSGNAQSTLRAVKHQAKAAFGAGSSELKNLMKAKFIKPSDV